MKRSSGFVKSVETWNVQKPGSTDKVPVEKIAVRDTAGRFHGATNFKTR